MVANLVVHWVEKMDTYSAAQSVVHSAGYWEVQLVAHLAEYLADLMEALSATRDLYK